MPRALLSVSDKREIVSFARALSERRWELVSTGGTARALRSAGLVARDVSEVTGHPEMMEGRIKTLHPAVHAGLLARQEHRADEAEMNGLGYGTFELLAVNLYPFRETVAREGVGFAEALEQIDIGGPAMLRSAAKNHPRVWAVVDPRDYARVIEALGTPAPELRRELAARVFAHTSAYDAAVAAYLRGGASDDRLPDSLDLLLEKRQDLRYGENPDQRAALYGLRDGAASGFAAPRQLHGKELSFNNLLDVDAALLAVSPWAERASEPACAIVKHTTPCGIALGRSVGEAYGRALATDPQSAFGSVVAFTVEVDSDAAEQIAANFVEAVVAPGFSADALERLRSKKNLRILISGTAAEKRGWEVKRVLGGVLVQEPLALHFGEREWRTVTRRLPTDAEMEDLRFAWRAVAAVKSNAILLARDRAAIGIGAGQMSRVDSSWLAVEKARRNGRDIAGAVLASDAFFPFRDGVDAAAEAGVRAIIQPGGSVRDAEVIAAADEHAVAMIFTGRRLFRH